MEPRGHRRLALLLSVGLLSLGCNMLAASSRSQADIEREWANKGFGFVWDEAIPDSPVSESPLHFSGVAYGCTINSFYANLTIEGPIGDGGNMTLNGSAAMAETPLVGLVGSETSALITYSLENVPLTGLVTTGDGNVCDADLTVSLFSVQVDLVEGTATITQATASEPRMTCEGMTIEMPFVMRLPLPASTSINALETEACREDLESIQ